VKDSPEVGFVSGHAFRRAVKSLVITVAFRRSAPPSPHQQET